MTDALKVLIIEDERDLAELLARIKALNAEVS